MTPVRIQRKRTKGWKAPEGAVYVGRPSKWGNPVKVNRLLSRKSAKTVYEFYVWPDADQEQELSNRQKFYLSLARGKKAPSMEMIRRELSGKDLICWCPLGEPCHADVLLEIANQTEVSHDRAI